MTIQYKWQTIIFISKYKFLFNTRVAAESRRIFPA